MPLWWGKSSSKDLKRRPSRGSFIAAIHWKFRSGSQGKNSSKSRGSERFTNDIISQKELALSRSALTSLQVSRCESFAEESHAQPLPLPGLCLADVENAESDSCTSRLESQGCFPIHGHVREKPLASDAWGDLATASVSSNSSMDTDDKPDSRLLSPLVSDCESGNITAINSPSRNKDQSPTVTRRAPNLPSNNNIPYTSAKRQGPLNVHMSKLQIPPRAVIFSPPDSLISSQSQSPVGACGHERVRSSGFCSEIPCSEANLVSSGHRSSPRSDHTSGRNSVGGDMPLLWPQSRCSPECSPIPSPKMASPGRDSRIHSGGVTPLHPRAGGLANELPSDKPGDGKLQTHRLPLPPVTVSTSPFSASYSTITTPSHLRNPGRTESSMNSTSRWKKGCLIGSGTFGRVYKVFNSETGETCAMKEVTLFSDDAKSKENLQQLGQEVTLLSCLRHPNIVRYIESEMVDDKLYIYLEYVSGGSILKILREYGQLGESAIRSYTRQILCGLVYLHAKNIVHRDVKGANILVDPNGTVKLADFGMAKHITGQSCPLSFKGSPYWMAPEVIRNSNGYNIAVDIWSLGCTVIEMATAKPPWSQYEGVAALFKIGNSKELPTIPDHLSVEGKDFVRQCLQRNPVDRPTATQLLEHPFVRSLKNSECPFSLRRFTNVASHKEMGRRKKLSRFDSGMTVKPCSGSKIDSGSSKSCMPKHVSCPVSPIGSPLLHVKSSQPTRRMTIPTVYSTHTASASSTPYTAGNETSAIHHFNHSRAYSYEGVGLQHPQKGLYVNGSSLFTRPTSETLHGIPETVPTKKKLPRSQFVQLVRQDPRESCDRHAALAAHVSQQLLMNYLEVNPSSASSVLCHTDMV